MTKAIGQEIQGPFEVTSSEESLLSPLPPQFGTNSALDLASVNDEDAAVETMEPPERRYGCSNYDSCLDLAAALNWESFTCKSCSGTINEKLYWRAHQATRKDSVAKALCDLPPLSAVGTSAKANDK